MASFMLPSTRVRVAVAQIRDTGVWVKILKSNRAGFIRRKELSWDRRIGVMPTMPQVGSEFDAIVLEDDPQRGLVFLSLRQAADPWDDVGVRYRYRIGQSVEGEVVNVQHDRAFVQLEPGIDAVVWRDDLPILRDLGVEDLLWIGDRVRGLVTKMSPTLRQIDLSLWGELRRLASVQEQSHALADLLRTPEPQPTSLPHQDGSSDQEGLTETYRFLPPIPRPHRFLVVDDDVQDRERICEALKREFGVEVDGLSSGDQALELVRGGHSYGLAIVDVYLDGELGPAVATRLRTARPGLPVLFVSRMRVEKLDLDFAPPSHDPELNRAEAPVIINGSELPVVAEIEKPTDPLIDKTDEEIVDWVHRLCTGYWTRVIASRSSPGGSQSGFLERVGLKSLAKRSLHERLLDALMTLRETIQISQAMVLELDTASKIVSILAADPPVPPGIAERAVGTLYHSPARNVIEEEQEFRFTEALRYEEARLRNLFPDLRYRSCFGLPLLIPGRLTRHALFLFDERILGFSTKSREGREQVDRARLGAGLLATTIENAILLDHMRGYQEHCSRGELLANLVHELNHKLDGLNWETKLLQGYCDKAQAAPDQARGQKIADSVHRLAQQQGSLSDLVKGYTRLARHELDLVNVNEAVTGVLRQLEHRARAAGIMFATDLSAGLPKALAIRPQLEQILTNLILNSIQQIELKMQFFGQLHAEQGEQADLARVRQVIVQTRRIEGFTGRPLEIAVMDSGPGIHGQLHERVFEMGYTTRPDGAGLGLYISRNLVEMTGGSLSLAASLMFIGTAFVVKLPCAKQEKDEHHEQD